MSAALLAAGREHLMFTVATLLDWYRDGGNVQARLPVLSTWLGHVDPKSTYWYYSDSESYQLFRCRNNRYLWPSRASRPGRRPHPAGG